MPVATITPEDGPSPILIPANPFSPAELFRVKDIPPAAFYVPDFVSIEEETYLLRKLAESPQPKWKTVGTGRRVQYWGGSMSKSGVLLPEPLPDFMTTFPDITERIHRFLATVPSAAQRDGPDIGTVLDINQVLVNEYRPGQGITPHEDGDAFRPVVATVSLGSHTVLNIHHYLSTTSPSPPMTATSNAAAPSGRAGPIAAIPLAHFLLLPRSLLILSSSVYVSHLHGISSRTGDTVLAAPPPPGDEEGVVIANAELLGDAAVIDSLRDTGRWSKERGVRTSLTFRHSEKVLKGGAFSMATGGLKRGLR